MQRFVMRPAINILVELLVAIVLIAIELLRSTQTGGFDRVALIDILVGTALAITITTLWRMMHILSDSDSLMDQPSVSFLGFANIAIIVALTFVIALNIFEGQPVAIPLPVAGIILVATLGFNYRLRSVLNPKPQ